MIKRLCHIIFMVMPLAGPAQTGHHLPLDTILLRIDSAWPAVKSFDVRIASFRAAAEGARAWMPPQVMIGADQFPYSLTGLDMQDPMNRAAVMIDLEQMIPNPSKLSAKRNYLLSLENAEADRLAWFRNGLRADARMLYYKRYAAERKTEVLRENREVISLLISSAEARYAYNRSDAGTIFKAKAKLAELDNMDLMLKGMITEASIGLNVLMNRPPAEAFVIDTFIYPVTDTSLNQPPPRHDVLEMESLIRSMELNRKLMAYGARPDFGIRLTHMQALGMPETFGVTGMMTIPIVPWSSPMYRSEVKAMDLQIRSMQLDAEAMGLMAQRMIEERKSMLTFEYAQLLNYEQQVIPLYRKSLEASLLAWKQNSGSFYVVLDAWEMLLMKQMEYYDKVYKVLSARTEYLYETEQ